jgi:lysophospholipase L1-like esterase
MRTDATGGESAATDVVPSWSGRARTARRLLLVFAAVVSAVTVGEMRMVRAATPVWSGLLEASWTSVSQDSGVTLTSTTEFSVSFSKDDEVGDDGVQYGYMTFEQERTSSNLCGQTIQINSSFSTSGAAPAMLYVPGLRAVGDHAGFDVSPAGTHPYTSSGCIGGEIITENGSAGGPQMQFHGFWDGPLPLVTIPEIMEGVSAAAGNSEPLPGVTESWTRSISFRITADPDFDDDGVPDWKDCRFSQPDPLGIDPCDPTGNDRDEDGVPDDTDQCPAIVGPAPTGCPGGVWMAALGDSYSSGEGTLDYEFPTDSPGSNHCHRSHLAYPSQGYAELGGVFAYFTSFACSGALTEHLLEKRFCGSGCDTPDPHNDGFAPQLVRLEALQQLAVSQGSTVGLVTLGIGGNDAGFADVVKSCLAQPDYHPLDLFDQVRIDCSQRRLFGEEPHPSFIYGSIRSVLDEIRRIVPTARVIMVGYPRFVQAPADDGDCPVEFSATEARWLEQQIGMFNTGLKQDIDQYAAANDAPVDFLSLDHAYAGHGICANGEQYVHQLRIRPNLTVGPPLCIGISFLVGTVCNESFHPNAAGHAAAGAALAQCVRNRSFCGIPLPSTGAPAVQTAQGAPSDDVCASTTPSCTLTRRRVTVQGTGFLPGSTVHATLFSNPADLGSAVADASGAVTLTAQIPKWVPAGLHHLILTGDGDVTFFRSAVIELVVPEVAPLFIGLAPARLLETRPGELTVDGAAQGQGRTTAGGVIELLVAGRGGVPPDASAVSLNVTAVGPAGPGFVTVYPCDVERPLASNLNFTSAGVVVPNAVLTPLSDDGKVCLYTLTETDLIVDVNGSFPAASDFIGLAPARLLETRPGELTVDGVAQGDGRIPAGSVVELPITGRGGVPVGASAVSLNVTVVNPSGPGFVTVYPCDVARPLASNLNFTSAGVVVPNAVLTPLSDDGKVCLYTLTETDLIVDVNGSFPGL